MCLQVHSRFTITSRSSEENDWLRLSDIGRTKINPKIVKKVDFFLKNRALTRAPVSGKAAKTRFYSRLTRPPVSTDMARFSPTGRRPQLQWPDTARVRPNGHIFQILSFCVFVEPTRNFHHLNTFYPQSTNKIWFFFHSLSLSFSHYPSPSSHFLYTLPLPNSHKAPNFTAIPCPNCRHPSRKLFYSPSFTKLR